MKQFAHRLLLGSSVVLGAMLVAACLASGLAKQPTSQFLPNSCSRYCHNQGCAHVGQFRNSPALLRNPSFRVAYRQTIRWLRNNPFGWSYQTMNLVLYLLLFPATCSLLLWGLLRNPSRP